MRRDSLQHSQHTRTLLPGLKRKSSIRRPSRRFFRCGCGGGDWPPATTSFLLGKVLAVAAILVTNLYLFNLHDRSLDVGVKRLLRMERVDPSFSVSQPQLWSKTTQEQQESRQAPTIATNDVSLKADKAKEMAPEKPKAMLLVGEDDRHRKAESFPSKVVAEQVKAQKNVIVAADISSKS